MKINFERLVSRSIVITLSRQLDLAGMKMPVNKLLTYMIVPGVIGMIVVSAVLFALYQLEPFAAVGLGIVAWAGIIAALYLYIQYRIDGRRTRMETILPDYFQLASANLRSGIALDRAMVLAARPEFGFFTDDVREMSRKTFSGETLENALRELATRYRSTQLQRSIRMMIESIKYGGAVADLLEQLARDLRSQQLAQKEVAGQMLMYSIFIAFAALVAAPVLYGLTNQMIIVTDTVWKGILAQNPGGLPSEGVSFLKPQPPQITPAVYYDFSLAAIIIITAFASLIMSAINSGSVIKGIRYLPVFILMGIGIFFVVGHIIALLFAGIAGV